MLRPMKARENEEGIKVRPLTQYQRTALELATTTEWSKRWQLTPGVTRNQSAEAIVKSLCLRGMLEQKFASSYPGELHPIYRITEDGRAAIGMPTSAMEKMRAGFSAEYQQYLTNCFKDEMPIHIAFTFDEWLMHELQETRDQLRQASEAYYFGT